VEIAVGFVETRGYTGLAQATDAMVKAAAVEFFREEHIGGGFVTTMVRGEVAAVRSSVTAGAAVARDYSELVAESVISGLNENVMLFLEGHRPPPIPRTPVAALGVIETQGFAAMVNAADAACDAADVIFSDVIQPGGGYSVAIFRGDVAAVRSAVEAGVEQASRVTKVIGKDIIPSPHDRIQALFPLGSAISLEEEAIPTGRALGLIETRGFTGLVEAADRAVKAATVDAVSWHKVGTAMVSFIIRGDVGAIRAAVAAGEAGAREVGNLVSTLILPGPDPAVEGVVPPPPKKK
jgi:microcompartment protein CcmL/EutN